jgi:hypothetical protein
MSKQFNDAAQKVATRDPRLTRPHLSALAFYQQYGELPRAVPSAPSWEQAERIINDLQTWSYLPRKQN